MGRRLRMQGEGGMGGYLGRHYISGVSIGTACSYLLAQLPPNSPQHPTSPRRGMGYKERSLHDQALYDLHRCCSPLVHGSYRQKHRDQRKHLCDDLSARHHYPLAVLESSSKRSLESVPMNPEQRSSRTKARTYFLLDIHGEAELR